MNESFIKHKIETMGIPHPETLQKILLVLSELYLLVAFIGTFICYIKFPFLLEHGRSIRKIDDDGYIENINNSCTKNTISHKPIVKNKITHKPIVKETISHTPIVKETISHKPIVKETISHNPIVKETISHKPIVKETISHKPIVKETINQPIVKILSFQLLKFLHNTRLSKRYFYIFYSIPLILTDNLYLIHPIRRLIETKLYTTDSLSKMTLLQFIHGIFYYVSLSVILDGLILNPTIFIFLNILQGIFHYRVYVMKKREKHHYFLEGLIYVYIFSCRPTVGLFCNMGYVIIFIIATIIQRK